LVGRRVSTSVLYQIIRRRSGPARVEQVEDDAIGELRKKYVDFCGITSPARHTVVTDWMLGGFTRNAAAASAGTAAIASASSCVKASSFVSTPRIGSRIAR
jgi:hypothetical protein